MAGAMAGSATFYYNQPSDSLQVLTLTINNRCNLSCPHCYLQYEGERSCISEDLIENVLASDFSHLAIVGKEPLVDGPSTRITERLILGCAESRKTISLITNGIGLSRLKSELLHLVEWIDVSLDGGAETYHRYRKSDYRMIVEQSHHVLRSGLKTLNALHTLSDANLSHVDDMVAVSKDVPWNQIIFSPFVRVRNHGRMPVSAISGRDLFSALRNSAAFMDCETAKLLLGADAFREQGFDITQILEQVEKAGLSHKVIKIPCDPLELGYMRVTYDGFVMTPNQSLHPADYRSAAMNVKSFCDLKEAFTSLTPVLM